MPAGAAATLGRYVLLRQSGEGRHVAYDPELDRTVELHLLPGEAEDGATALPLAQAARFSDPRFVPIFDSGLAEGTPYVTTALAEEPSLTAWLAARPRRWSEVVDVLRAAGEALAAAHAAGIAHGAVGPEALRVGEGGAIRWTPLALTPGDPARDAAAYAALLRTCLGEGAGVPASLRRLASRLGGATPSGAAAALAAFRRRRRLRVRLALAAGLVTIVAAPLTVLAIVTPQPRCTDSEKLLAGLWDEPRRAEVKRAFAATRRPFAPAAWRSVSAVLDRWTQDLASGAQAACEAFRVEGRDSEADFERRTRCLEGRRRALAALVDVLAHADGKVVEKALGAAQALPGTALCGNLPLLRRRPEPPRDAAAAAAAERIDEAVARARAMHAAGKVRESLRLALETEKSARALGYTPALAAALEVLGVVLWELGDAKQARERLVEAYLTAERGRDDDTAARAAAGQVWVVGYMLGRTPECVEWAEHARAALRRYGGEHPEIESPLYNQLGAALRLGGFVDEAALSQLHALEIAERAFGPNDVRTAKPLFNLSSGYAMRGQHYKGMPLLSRARGIIERSLGPDHPLMGFLQTNLGAMYSSVGRPDQAIVHHRNALRVYERVFGAGHPMVAQSLVNVASSLTRKGLYRDALAHLARAKELLDRMAKPPPVRVAFLYLSRGRVHHEMGDFAAALRDTEQGLALRRSVSPNSPDIGEALIAAGQIELTLGARTKARVRFEEAARLYAKAEGDRAAAAKMAFGDLARAEGDFATALRFYREAGPALESGVGADSMHVGELRVKEGEMLLARGEGATAVAMLEEALALMRRVAPNPRKVGSAAFALAKALWESPGGRPRARVLATEAREIFAAQPEADPRPLAEVRKWLEEHQAQ